VGKEIRRRHILTERLRRRSRKRAKRKRAEKEPKRNLF